MNLRTDERCKEQLTLLSYMFLLVGYCGSAAAVQLYLYYFSPRVNIIYYPCSGRFIDRTDNVEFNYYNRICTYIRWKIHKKNEIDFIMKLFLVVTSFLLVPFQYPSVFLDVWRFVISKRWNRPLSMSVDVPGANVTQRSAVRRLPQPALRHASHISHAGSLHFPLSVDYHIIYIILYHYYNTRIHIIVRTLHIVFFFFFFFFCITLYII